MIHPTDPLHEPLRLLRQTSLPAGFEERLADRLARAHREDLAKPHRFGGPRRTILLLAAVALPAAAFASGGWLLEQRRASTTPTSEVSREAKSLPKITSKPFALQVPVTSPPLPAVQELSVSEQLTHSREPTHAASTAPNSRATQATERSRAVASRPAQESERSNTAPTVAAGREAPTSKAPTLEAPARIESLELSIPRGEKAGDSAGRDVDKPTSDSLRLRESTDRGASQSNVERDRSGAQRERAGERRGSDAAQQARERVQARERKGQ